MSHALFAHPDANAIGAPLCSGHAASEVDSDDVGRIAATDRHSRDIVAVYANFPWTVGRRSLGRLVQDVLERD